MKILDCLKDDSETGDSSELSASQVRNDLRHNELLFNHDRTENILNAGSARSGTTRNFAPSGRLLAGTLLSAWFSFGVLIR